MPFAIKVELTGLKDALDSIQDLKRSAQSKILRPALAAGTMPMLKAAKAKAPVGPSGTKLLKKSIGRTIKTDRRTGTVTVRIGPRTGYRIMRQTKSGKVNFADPVKYAHLVEKGHVLVRGGRQGKGGKVVGHVAAKPFLLPAAEETKAQAVEIIKQKIVEGLDKHWRKGGGR